MYLLDIDLAGYIAKMSPILDAELDSKPTLRFTLNSALFVLIVSLIIDFFKHPSEITVDITNNSRKKDSYFDIRSTEPHRPVIVHLDFKIDFKNKFIGWSVKRLGGLTLNCIYPHWIDCSIDNKTDLKTDTLLVDQKGEFVLDIGQTLQSKQNDLKLYVKLALISNSFDINEGELNPFIDLKTTKKANKLIIYLIIVLFFDIKISKYKIEARNDIR